VRILGVSALYHDSAAALLDDGEIVAAAQEERFTRVKHDPRFPQHAIAYCLGVPGISLDAVDYVVFYEKPFLKFERLLETYLAVAPRGFRSFSVAMPLWLKDKLLQKRMLGRELSALGGTFDVEQKLLFAEHHQSHAASAFYPSPFQEAAVLTMDGVGEWATTTIGHGRGSTVELTKEIQFPHSLGLLYSAFTSYLGFRVNSGEYKLMGLAPYGEPRYAQTILDRLVDVKADGSFRLDLSYFEYLAGTRMTNESFHALFGGQPRRPDEPPTRREMDLAASIQSVTEEIVLRLTRSLASDTGSRNLCLAGGVALNCVANGKVLRDGRFHSLWVQPAAGDAGGALGAALAVHHELGGGTRVPRLPDGMHGSYLGPEFSDDEIVRSLGAAGATYERLASPDVIERTARSLADGEVVGWFQGRMEFGPRALGARSILGDPRSPTMQTVLNVKVKRRESFRPFAPSVLREDAEEWFDLDVDSPYMLLVAPVAQSRQRPTTPDEDALTGIEKLRIVRSEIPAVTHVDHSARIQTVHRETNPAYHALLEEFKRLTGCPVLVNTSFNVRGEPIVCTPEDALRCFMTTNIDVLVAGSCVLRKQDQRPSRVPIEVAAGVLD